MRTVPNYAHSSIVATNPRPARRGKDGEMLTVRWEEPGKEMSWVVTCEYATAAFMSTSLPSQNAIVLSSIHSIVRREGELLSKTSEQTDGRFISCPHYLRCRCLSPPSPLLGTGQTVEIGPLLKFLIPSIYWIFRASQNANSWRIINQMFAKFLPVDARVTKIC